MDAIYSTNHKFKRMFANILSIFAILAIALANTGFSVQTGQRSLPGDWDSKAVQKASVLHDEGGYKMWYDGVSFQDQTEVGLATSDDGISGKIRQNPLLTGGPEAWDSSGEHGPFVMKDADGYKMWYEGSDGNKRQLGYATSPDGISWTKYEGNPVLQAGPQGYDQNVAGHGSVLYEDGLYKLWYHAIGDQGVIIAYATSPDGVDWSKQGPVLVGAPDGWDAALWGPSVLKANDSYWMWYSAAGSIIPSIGLATSEDGVSWTRVGDAPVITIAYNSIGDPHVIFDGGMFKMWFNNFSDGVIYYAESNDGIQWTDPNPVLRPGLLFPLEGWHDGSYGEVDQSACVAFGWAVDPEDRDRDVQVRVLSDGEQVAEGLAQDYGEDMDSNNICPGGTCRFTINLWDLISHDQEHQITVQAYDEESADWWNLEGTPKSLTCLTPVPRVYANLPEDGIRFEYSAPGASVNFSIYDSPDGNLLWEGSRTADDSGFVYLSIWDHRVDLKPGMYIVASDDMFTKQLLVERVTLDVFDPVENILGGTAEPGRRNIWVVANNDSVFCGTNVDADPDGNWTVDFDGYECDVTHDMWAYTQVMDPEDDTSEAVPDFIEGYHDYDSGDAPSWACNAGGWVVDSDDRERDLTIRILADGNEVTSLTAGNPREDLLGVCGADGSCGFETNLWGLITPYEEHQITTQAYDEEAEQWFDLNNTPRNLTCRTYDIYTFDPSTGTTRQIANLRDTHEYNPRWSPDGKKIVHDTWSTDWGSHGIYITDVKTGVSTPLAGAEGGSYPTWSPSGKWIAFDRGADNDYRLFIVPPTGGVPKLVREDAFMASWAPNGQRLAFHQPSDGSIRTIDLKGGSETIVAERGIGPAWSPDGEWIAFELDGDVWRVSVDSRGNPLGDPIQLTSSPVWEGRPTWSNNSKTIAFHAGMGQDTDIWTVSASGGTETWLTGAPVFGDYDANYSFNGRYVAYSSFSLDGQAARHWGAAFSYDVGTWAEGEHSYYLEDTYSVPASGGETTEPIGFTVSNDAPSYDGYVLLRGAALRARVGDECPALAPATINPDQNTRFHYGWVTDTPMTYAEAVAHFDSMTVKAYWDNGMTADLLRHEIFSWTSVDWPQYTCSATAP
jgi:Tol biopolymer transport system component/predicted GH43/DUF377 family glycosyl hydrolase